MAPFTYAARPARILFGAGRLAELGTELGRLNIRRPLILCTPEQSDLAGRVAKELGDRTTGVHAQAAMHTPVSVTKEAFRHVRAFDADGLVPIGGGSATGLGKALAMRTGLPQVAVPTTYAGSEMTPILGETDNGRKVTRRSDKVLPQTVIYDVELTLSLPGSVSAVSGVNALAHAIEALYAHDGNPIISMLAEEGIAALGRSLPQIVTDPAGDRTARRDALYGAWLCGTCLAAVTMGLHHKICHVLGGAFDLPHAATHAVMLPHVAAYNTSAAVGAMSRAARALGATDAVEGLCALNRRLGVPSALRELGMPEAGVEEAVDLALQDRYPNPRALERESLTTMLRHAWAGDPPQASLNS